MAVCDWCGGETEEPERIEVIVRLDRECWRRAVALADGGPVDEYIGAVVIDALAKLERKRERLS